MALQPGLVVFDLDYTLWPMWVDTHVDPPFQAHPSVLGSAVDRHGRDIHLFPDVPRIVSHLQRQGVKIGIASRTSAPEAARQLMRVLLLPGCSPALPHEAAFPDSLVAAQSARGSGAGSIPASVPAPVPGGGGGTHGAARMASVFHYAQIYPGDKQAHFEALHRDSGVDYCDMLFFDDETRNIVSVGGGLGVHAVHVDDETGVTWEVYSREIQAWREKRQGKR